MSHAAVRLRTLEEQAYVTRDGRPHTEHDYWTGQIDVLSQARRAIEAETEPVLIDARMRRLEGQPGMLEDFAQGNRDGALIARMAMGASS